MIIIMPIIMTIKIFIALKKKRFPKIKEIGNRVKSRRLTNWLLGGVGLVEPSIY